MANLKFPLIFEGTIAFLYSITSFSLLFFVERALTFIKTSTSFVSQASSSDDFDTTLEVIGKESKNDGDDLHVIVRKKGQKKFVIKRTMMEKVLRKK
jgi:hypothetical protein